MRRLFAAVLLLLVGSSTARADTVVQLRKARKHHVLYLELFGKGGLWGGGYENWFRSGVGLGGVVSGYAVADQRVLSVSPYLAWRPVVRGRHRLFVHIGPQLEHVRVSSPVPQWSGKSELALAAQLTGGYEVRVRRFLLRTSLSAVAGRGGVKPWVGFAFGVPF